MARAAIFPLRGLGACWIVAQTSGHHKSSDEDNPMNLLVSGEIDVDPASRDKTLIDAAQAAEAEAQFKFLEHVVRDEDYATGFRQQEALKNGGRDHVLFGQNEGGAQRFHHWVDRLIATDDAGLERLFARE